MKDTQHQVSGLTTKLLRRVEHLSEDRPASGREDRGTRNKGATQCQHQQHGAQTVARWGETEGKEEPPSVSTGVKSKQIFQSHKVQTLAR